MNPKITSQHHSKPAYIYIRQSTLAQVRHNPESTERQYALQDKAQALGWPQTRIRVLDRDLGQSGAQTAGREDFRTLIADVSMAQVGAVFALEVSRLARSNGDWYRLLELCAFTHTLVIDADGCYDPADFNDGLLLGLKGTMAQAELHFLRGRLQEGKLSKAKKGELRLPLPIGFCYDQDNRIVLDPDEEVRHAVELMFRLFRQTGSVYKIIQHLTQKGLQFPARKHAWAGGQLTWGRLEYSRAVHLMRNPIYAGVYVFGRHQCHKYLTPEGEVRRCSRQVPKGQWQVYMPDHHTGYLTLEEFEHNQVRLAQNQTTKPAAIPNGPAREGLALLQGLLLCGCCGRTLTVRYQGSRGLYPLYRCERMLTSGLGTGVCMRMRTYPLDNAISEAVLQVLKPAEFALAVAALQELKRRDEAIMHQWHLRIQRVEYEAALAQRRYEQCDPANRLVANTLEHRWNEALIRLEKTKMEAAQFERKIACALTPEQEAQVLALAHDLPQLWHAPTTSAQDRKRLLRLLISDITVEKHAQAEVILHVRWQGGACTDLPVTLPLPNGAIRYPAALVEQIRQLAQHCSNRQIVEHLNQAGFTHRGKPLTVAIIQKIRTRYEMTWPYMKRDNEVTVQQLAHRLQVTEEAVRYWIRHGMLQARQLHEGSPWWITLQVDTIPKLLERVYAKTSACLQLATQNDQVMHSRQAEKSTLA